MHVLKYIFIEKIVIEKGKFYYSLSTFPPLLTHTSNMATYKQRFIDSMPFKPIDTE